MRGVKGAQHAEGVRAGGAPWGGVAVLRQRALVSHHTFDAAAAEVWIRVRGLDDSLLTCGHTWVTWPMRPEREPPQATQTRGSVALTRQDAVCLTDRGLHLCVLASSGHLHPPTTCFTQRTGLRLLGAVSACAPI